MQTEGIAGSNFIWCSLPERWFAVTNISLAHFTPIALGVGCEVGHRLESGGLREIDYERAFGGRILNQTRRQHIIRAARESARDRNN